MKKSIFFSTILIILISLQIGGVTFAWFTDTAKTGSNTISTAKIVINATRDAGDPFPGSMFYFDGDTDGATTDERHQTGIKPDGYWYPGKVSGVKTLQIDNAINSIPIKLYKIDAVVEDPTPDNGVDDTILRNALWIKVFNLENGTLWEGYLSDLTDWGPKIFDKQVYMEVGSTHNIGFQASMTSGQNDNIYQGKDIKVQFRIYVVQQNAVGTP